MALQVWLPFNNNVQNYGLFVANPTGSYVYGNGNVTSKCLSFNGSTNAYYVKINDPIKSSNTEFSIATWFKLNSVSETTAIWNGRTTVGNAVSIFVINNTLRVDDSVQTTVSAGLQVNVWYHLCVTWKLGGKKTVYINGVSKSSVTAGTITNKANTYGTIGRSSAADSVSASNYFNGYINDFRIYDHCLSDKEVKELSKGLCLHYKLSRGGENLLKNTQAEKSWTYAGGSSYVDLKYEQETITPAADSYYTMSFDAKGSSNGSYLKTYLYNNNTGRQCDKIIVYRNGKKIQETASSDGYSGAISLTTEWQHFVIVRHFNTNATALTKQNVFRISGNTSSYSVYVRNAKIEEGDHATSWIPNKSDTLYSQLGYNSTEPDCSGYGNNGTIKGTPAYSNNTPRYEGSNYFGYDQNVQGNFGFNGFPITISFWAKVAAFDTSGWVVLAGQSSGYYLDADSSSGANWHSKATVQGYYRDGVLIASTNTTSQFISRDGNWHHYAYVCTLTDWTEMTVNGGSLWSSSWRAKVNISDFRIYATALSASDIKALYDTPVSIDNKNNLHSLEFIENSQENLLDNLNTQYTQKGSMSNSYNTSQPCFVPYNQTNCKCQYGSKPGFNFIRVANINDYASGGRTTYGGPRIDFRNRPPLKGHSYIIMFDYEGRFDSSSLPQNGWYFNDGWSGDAALNPNPTTIFKTHGTIVVNSEIKNRYYYAFTINDDIYKVCKTSFSSFVAGNTYLSYRDLAWHFSYATSGTGQGTDVYLTNFKMYDITNYVNSESFTKEGLIKMVDMDDFLSEGKLHKYGLISMNGFSEF